MNGFDAGFVLTAWCESQLRRLIAMAKQSSTSLGITTG